MSTGLAILLIVIAFLAGGIVGFFLARKYMVNYFEENPPVDAEMIRTMLVSMGQKPSEKRVRQITNQMKSRAKKNKN